MAEPAKLPVVRGLILVALGSVAGFTKSLSDR
jgi:hypothetical protein